MEFNRANIQNISWGVLLVVVAAALIVIGVSGLSILLIVPVVLLVMGVWIFVTGASYYMRAWGVVLTVAGGLWLSRWLVPVSLYVVAGIFLATIGALVIVGSRK